MLAVHPRMQGRGLARALLEDLHTASESHPDSVGVGLDTTNARNVTLYEHFGYQVLGCGKTPDGGLETWTLFRPDDADES